MSWFNTQNDMETYLDTKKKDEELNERLKSYIQEEAMLLFRTFRSEWSNFQKWLKMPLWERVLSNMTIENLSLQPFYISIVKIEDALKQNQLDSKIYQIILEKDIKELMESESILTPQKIANLYKNIFMFNISKEKKENPAKKLLEELSILLPSSTQTASEAVVASSISDDEVIRQTETLLPKKKRNKRRKKNQTTIDQHK